MAIVERLTYLDNLLCELEKKWPENRIVNVVCHGHSVPSGYFATPFIDTFNAYPHLFHKEIKERFPFSMINVILTSKGGENSQSGSVRFKSDVLCHKPDVVFIDYGLNDRGIGLDNAKKSWRQMIEIALKENIKVILLTPTWDKSYYSKNNDWQMLVSHCNQIRDLAIEYQVGLADAFNAFNNYILAGGELTDLLSHVNHPNRKGHELVVQELSRWFIAK